MKDRVGGVEFLEGAIDLQSVWVDERRLEVIEDGKTCRVCCVHLRLQIRDVRRTVT
jgi:hypothetical protein